jgi:hypothetical protein
MAKCERKVGRGGFEHPPLEQSKIPISEKRGTESGTPDVPTTIHDSDLVLVIECWPGLPKHIKKAIEVLVKAYLGTNGSVAVNIGEGGEVQKLEIPGDASTPIISVCAKLEYELSQLDAESKKQFMSDLGITESAAGKFRLEGKEYVVIINFRFNV